MTRKKPCGAFAGVHSCPSSVVCPAVGGHQDRRYDYYPIGEQRPVKILPHLSVTVIAAAALWVVPEVMAAQAPNSRDASRFTPAGSYLAARQADLDRDPDAAAAYFRAALKSDQRNPELLELTFYSVLAYGEIDEAVRLADRLGQLDRNNRNVHLVLGVRALKQKQWKDARAHFSQAMDGPVNDLIATLLSAWSAFGDRKSTRLNSSHV